MNKLLRFSRAELEFVDELAHLGGGSKSDSRSEGSEGGGSWSSCVREADDVFGTWASSARSRAAGVSSVTAYTDGREELTASRGVASVSSLSSFTAWRRDGPAVGVRERSSSKGESGEWRVSRKRGTEGRDGEKSITREMKEGENEDTRRVCAALASHRWRCPHVKSHYVITFYLC